LKTAHTLEDDISTSRLESFSDGVIAIIITIMVLDLRPPVEATGASLFALWPVFLSYVLSYLLIAIYWINHRHVLRYATRVTPLLLWLNTLLLFTISLIPFATAWLGAHLQETVPNVVYGLVQIASAVSFILWSEVVHRQNESRVEYAEAIRVSRRKGVIALGLYAAGIALAPFIPGTALFAAGIVGLLYFVPAVPMRAQ
jgi:uncharacterized membrane protein